MRDFLHSRKPWLVLGSVLSVSFVLFGCGGSGGGVGGHNGTTGTSTTTTASTTTTGTTGAPGITSFTTIEFPSDVADSGAVVGNNGGMEFYGGSGLYRSPSGTLVKLTGLDGTSNNAHVQSVNDSGEIVGNCAVNNQANATAWVNDKVVKLQVPTGFSTSLATSINDAGQIVGYGQNYVPGKVEIESVSELGNPTGGTFTLSFAAANGTEMTGGIPYNATAAQVEGNLDGLAAIQAMGGVKCAGGPLPTTPVSVSFPYSGPQPLFTVNSSGLSGGTNPSATVTQTQQGTASTFVTEGLYWRTYSSAPVVLSPAGLMPIQINANGEVVGYVSLGNGSSPWDYCKVNVSSPSAATMIGSTNYNPSIAINASGEIVLASGTSGSGALLISASGKSSTIFESPSSLSIDSQGDVCGSGAVSGNTVAILWTPSKGVTPLTNYLPKNSGWTTIYPTVLNDNGLIVGLGFYKGSLASFLLQLPKGAY